MRRLLILLLAMVAFGAIVPAAYAAPMHHGRMTMPAGGCHDEGQCVAHICLGCAMKPAEPPAPASARPPAAPSPVAAILRFVATHRPGFDPPPPRRFG